MAHRRLLLLLIVVPWLVVGAIPSASAVSIATEPAYVPGAVGDLLTAPDSNGEAPFAVSTETASKTVASQSGRLSRVRLAEGLLRRSSGITSRCETRIARLRFMNYSRALARANAGLPSWHSTTPPPLS